MDKIRFKNDEEAKEYIRKNINPSNFELPHYLREEVNGYYFDLLKREGYIEKSALEEVREYYNSIKGKSCNVVDIESIVILYEKAIKELTIKYKII